MTRLLNPGRTRIRLANRLAQDIPDIRGKHIIWTPERLYRRQGRHLKFCDAYAWSGVPFWADSGNMAGLFDCWNTMTECVKATKLIIEGTEIVIVKND